jgi:uncharacterized protein
MARPLLLAAAAITTAFYAFLSTSYVGISELGLIAGSGIIIAIATTLDAYGQRCLRRDPQACA